MHPADAGSSPAVGFPAQAVVEHHEGAQEGAEEDAGDEGEGSDDEEGDVVLRGQ